MHRLLSNLALTLGILGISSASFLSTLDEFRKVDSNKAAKRRSQVIGAAANPSNEDERELGADLNEPKSGSFIKTIDEYKNIDENNKLLKKDMENGNRNLGADLEGDLDCEEIERQCQCSGGGLNPDSPSKPRGPERPGGPRGPEGPSGPRGRPEGPSGPRGPVGPGPRPRPRPVAQQKNSYSFQNSDADSDADSYESGSDEAAAEDLKALGIDKPKKMSARLPLEPTPGPLVEGDGDGGEESDRQPLGFDMASGTRQDDYPDRGDSFSRRNRNRG